MLEKNKTKLKRSRRETWCRFPPRTFKNKKHYTRKAKHKSTFEI